MPQIQRLERRALEQMAETIRLFVAVESALKKKTPAILVITSATQGEGKSLLAAALAATAATGGKHRVAALDLNWYRPSLHGFFDLELTHGAGEILHSRLSDLVQTYQGGTLDILTAPQDHGSYIASSAEMLPTIKRLLQEASDAYDLIVVDSAAIFPTNRMMMDPVVLSSLATGVIMVVLTAATPKPTVKRAQKALEASGANVLGVVTNHRRIAD